MPIARRAIKKKKTNVAPSYLSRSNYSIDDQPNLTTIVSRKREAPFFEFFFTRGGGPKTPSHLEEKNFPSTSNATLHPGLCNVRVENERSFYHVALPSLAPPLVTRRWGILQPPPSRFFSSRDTSRGFPFAVPPPFHTGMDTVSTDEKSWWPRFRDTSSPSLFIYIYILYIYVYIAGLSPQ